MTPRTAFAFFHPDPNVVAEVLSDVQGTGRFDQCCFQSGSWLVCSGALQGTVGAAPRSGASTLLESSDPRVTAEAILERLGEAFPAQALRGLPGDFSFLGTAPDGALTVVHAVAGAVPIYLWQDGECAAVATSLTDIARFVPRSPEVDPFVLAIWCAGVPFFPGSRTFLRNVQYLRRGAIAQWKPPRGWQTQDYWSPSRSALVATSSGLEERAAHLRNVLIRSLDHSLASNGSNLFTVSGGVDSSSLVALAAGVLRRSFSTLTFFPPAPRHLAEAASFVDPLLERYESFIRRRWEWPLSRSQRITLAERTPKVVCMVVHPALGLLPAIVAAENTTVMLGGEFADDLLGSALTVPDWIANTSLPELLSRPDRIPFGARTLKRWAVQRVSTRFARPPVPLPARLPDFVHPDLDGQFHAWRESQISALAHDPHPRAFLTARLAGIDGVVAQNWEAAATLGVHRVFPFLSREVMELAYECHPGELLGPDSKRLLRRALAGLVPAANLLRQTRGGLPPIEEWAPWTEPLPAELDGVLRPGLVSEAGSRLPAQQALRLRQLLNIVEALRIQRQARGKAIR